MSFWSRIFGKEYKNPEKIFMPVYRGEETVAFYVLKYNPATGFYESDYESPIVQRASIDRLFEMLNEAIQ